MLDFSKSRVSPLLADNPFLAKMMTDTDTAGLKRIGEAHLYLRGMQSTVGMKSVPADMVVFDELDEAAPAAKAMALERLAHSDYKRVIELSNPSLPDYGIDESTSNPTSGTGRLKCPACGAWTALDKEFPLKLGEEVRIILPRPDGTFYRACPKCSAELDLDAGEWVADFPDRPIHGYRISQLFSSKVDPGEILREYRTTRYPDRFYNLKIGIPWADLERRLDMSTVLALCSEEPIQEKAEESGDVLDGHRHRKPVPRRRAQAGERRPGRLRARPGPARPPRGLPRLRRAGRLDEAVPCLPLRHRRAARDPRHPRVRPPAPRTCLHVLLR